MKRNPQILPMSHRPVGSVAADYMLMPPDALRESEFYHVWFKPQHVRWSMACSLWRSEERIAVIGIRRHGRTQPRFGAEDLKFVERIRPHLGHAAALDARLRRLEFERDAAFDGLSRFCDGVVIVDSTHRILFANAAAERLLERAHPLHVRDGKLFTRHGPMASKLTKLIGLATSADLGCRSAGAMSMLGNGPIPLSIVVTPVGEMEGTFAPIRDPCAMILISDTSRSTAAQAAPQDLRDVFALTPTEAAIASRLADGQGVKTIAKGMGTSVSTVRTHLHRLFNKTGTRRQADLVRLVLLTSHPASLG
jgi:DNA-binding CsgD family transcriptional regulator